MLRDSEQERRRKHVRKMVAIQLAEDRCVTLHAHPEALLERLGASLASERVPCDPASIVDHKKQAETAADQVVYAKALLQRLHRKLTKALRAQDPKYQTL